jgi:triacylglycerol lipase
MNNSIRNQLRGLGSELSPPLIQATQRLFAASFAGMDPSTSITRDHRYGPDERHRLDIFNKASQKQAPVLVFVHGGGFVMGDKRAPDLPFYDNIGNFAVLCGYVGVTMTYRLAPANPWPAGSEDVAAAVKWLRANVANHGGDPTRIFLMGQSAGAVHVAGYVADKRLHAPEGAGLAGALMISGSYDVAQADANAFHLAYYGDAAESWPERSTIGGLTSTDLPLFFSVSELDGADFQKQAALLVSAFTRARGRFPQMHWLAGHNHLSPVLAVGSPAADTLGPLIQQFIAATAP